MRWVKRILKSILYPLYEARLFRRLNLRETPEHVGVILDGNRRWAKANASKPMSE
jgi:short-chain Z-isoprenyl diphosphate synthase